MTVPRPALVKKYADFVGKLSNGLLTTVRHRRRVVAIIGGNMTVAHSYLRKEVLLLLRVWLDGDLIVCE